MRPRGLHRLRLVLAGSVLAIVALLAIAAPILGTSDPGFINTAFRNQTPGTVHLVVDVQSGTTRQETAWMGTDSLGRDLYSRVLYGGRVSLIMGLVVTAASGVIGLCFGLVSGYIKLADAIIMRMMDGLMSIPTIMISIALVSLTGPGLGTVIVAIVIPEVPRVARLARAVVLSIRNEAYVEAAIMIGLPLHKILLRHVLPNIAAPLIVQASAICGSAILIEAALSFLGAGIPPETPSWGNIMANGRVLFQVHPHILLFPGAFLAATILAVNIFGDGLRDVLDRRFSGRLDV